MPALGLAIGPRAGPGPQFDFSAGALPPGAVLTRASPATCVGADGRVATLPPDAARFDHDPGTGARLGLLVEPEATNGALRSLEIADPAWLTYAGVAKVGPVAGAAPDGGAAMRIAFGSAGGVDIAAASALYQEPALPPGEGAWVASFWVRAVSGATRVRLGLYPGFLPVVSTGDVAVTADRWTRAFVSAAAITSGSNLSLRNDVAGASADVLVWGAQIEPGTAPTSTIMTDADPVTRAADDLSLDWGRLGIADGPVTLRLFFADGLEDVDVTIVGGVAAVPPRCRPLVAVRLA